MTVVSALISQISQYLRILNSIVVERIIGVGIPTGNGKGNHRAIFKDRADNAAVCGIKSFSAEYNFHSSRSQQALIKGEQRLVDFKNIILFLPNEILDDNIELAAGAEGVACATALLGRTF